MEYQMVEVLAIYNFGIIQGMHISFFSFRVE